MFTKCFVLITLITAVRGVYIRCNKHRKIFEEMKDFLQPVSSSKEGNITLSEWRKLVPAYSPPNVTDVSLIPGGFQITIPGNVQFRS